MKLETALQPSHLGGVRCSLTRGTGAYAHTPFFFLLGGCRSWALRSGGWAGGARFLVFCFFCAFLHILRFVVGGLQVLGGISVLGC